MASRTDHYDAEIESAAQLPQGAVLTERRLASVPMSNNHAAVGRRSLRLRERRLRPLGSGCRFDGPDDLGA